MNYFLGRMRKWIYAWICLRNLAKSYQGNDKSPDGFGVGIDSAQIRAQKDPQWNGRVYEISFEADDDNGGTCTDSVNVVVPKNKKTDPVDDGQNFDSTIP